VTKFQVKMKKVSNYQEFIDFASDAKKAFLLLYKNSDAINTDCAYINLTKAASQQAEIKVCTANVADVRDIHEKFNIASVPTLIELHKGKMTRSIKGCHDVNFYTNTLLGFTNTPVSTKGKTKVQKSVVVYSTPSCSWCNTLKNYLKDHQIAYRDIDVSRDQKAAAEMVKRSGQHGVPQSLIGGELIVGFDKSRIDKLLQIHSK
jgi:glutaredoxin-like YruB-family protein